MQEEFVIVLEVMVLPHPTDDSYMSYRENKNTNFTRKQWFDDEIVVGNMRYDKILGCSEWYKKLDLWYNYVKLKY